MAPEKFKLSAGKRPDKSVLRKIWWHVLRPKATFSIDLTKYRSYGLRYVSCRDDAILFGPIFPRLSRTFVQNLSRFAKQLINISASCHACAHNSVTFKNWGADANVVSGPADEVQCRDFNARRRSAEHTSEL